MAAPMIAPMICAVTTQRSRNAKTRRHEHLTVAAIRNIMSPDNICSRTDDITPPAKDSTVESVDIVSGK
jgi:hypothetical protein